MWRREDHRRARDAWGIISKIFSFSHFVYKALEKCLPLITSVSPYHTASAPHIGSPPEKMAAPVHSSPASLFLTLAHATHILCVKAYFFISVPVKKVFYVYVVSRKKKVSVLRTILFPVYRGTTGSMTGHTMCVLRIWFLFSFFSLCVCSHILR